MLGSGVNPAMLSCVIGLGFRVLKGEGCIRTKNKGLKFPKIKGYLSGIPIIRIIVFWGLHRGPPILGNYHMRVYKLIWGLAFRFLLVVGREERNISHRDCIGMDYILLFPTKHQQAYGIGGFKLRPSMCMLKFMGGM